MTDTPRRRGRRDPDPSRVREGLDAIGTQLGTHIPPPAPPGLGEAMLEQIRASARDEEATAMAEQVTLAGDGLSPEIRQLVALARIEERQKAMQDAHRAERVSAEARWTTMMSRLDTFVPRSEIEKDRAAMHARIDDLEDRHGDRLDKLEGRIWKAIAWVLGTVGTAIASVFGLHIKGAG